MVWGMCNLFILHFRSDFVNNKLSFRMLDQIADKKTMAGRMNESLGTAPASELRSQLRQFLSKLGVSPKQKIECRLCWE